jgi:hypothetical protein
MRRWRGPHERAHRTPRTLRLFGLFGPAWHITKKDLRASHALIIVGVLLGVVETLLRTWWPPLTMSLDPESTDFVNAVKDVLPQARSLAGALLVAQLVHADPLVGEQGFWLTRPISRGALFVSKVMTIMLAIVAPTFLGQVAPMIAFGVPPLDVTRLVSEYLLYQATGLIVVFAAAALTPNVRSLVTWGASLGILWALVMMLFARRARRS